MKKIFLSIWTLVFPFAAVVAQEITQEHKDRAKALVKQMTLEEKINFVGGYKDGFHTMPVERLGIPQIRLADGPQGVRNNTKSTLFACGVAAAATWNPTLAFEMGAALGEDSRARGVHILLGPGVNIYRSPLCGRNFEYMGEDPYLCGSTAVGYIKGVQSKGVMATVKHFALNNLEYDRHHMSSDADERTMNEIYFPAFKRAVQEAKVGSVMTSYNLVNNVHAAENPYLIEEILRGEWGFEGFVMSDWTSTYSTLQTVKNGVDLEMPQAFVMTYDAVLPLIERGLVLESEIDEKVQRILQTYIAFGFLDRPQLDTSIPEDNPYSREVAFKLSSESAVLLKNNGALPLKPGKRNTTVLLGPNAGRIPCGGGSGEVDPIYSISLKDGMEQLGSKYPVKYLFPSEGLDYNTPENIKALTEASAVVLSVGFDTNTEKERADRTFTLPEGQDELIDFVLSYNDNVVVVIYSGGGVDMSKWGDRVSAIIMGWYPGQEGGLAIAKILSGEISPSGRLPMSIEFCPEDNPTFNSYYPSKPLTKRGFTNRYVTYTEGVFVGYRGYDRSGVKPAYPFGFGLTYSEFEYSGLEVVAAGDGFDVSFVLKNVGKADAAEVAQVYVGALESAVPRPVKELKGFEKVFLKKGESKTVTIHLGADAFEYFDMAEGDFVSESGRCNIMVGSSYQDILLSEEITR